jgi:hypothetical protein
MHYIYIRDPAWLAASDCANGTLEIEELPHRSLSLPDIPHSESSHSLRVNDSKRVPSIPRRFGLVAYSGDAGVEFGSP